MPRSTNSATVNRAKQLRQAMSLPEVRLWQVLRQKPQGLKFRRQHPIGPFIADFYCAAAKLAFEIDGFVHETGDQPRRDAARDAYLLERGIRTVRIPAAQVLADVEQAAESICATCLAQ